MLSTTRRLIIHATCNHDGFDPGPQVVGAYSTVENANLAIIHCLKQWDYEADFKRAVKRAERGTLPKDRYGCFDVTMNEKHTMFEGEVSHFTSIGYSLLC